MDNQKVGSPRATDSPRRLPDDDATPFSPRKSVPRVFEKHYSDLLSAVGLHGSLSQLVYEISNELIPRLRFAIGRDCAKAALPHREPGMNELVQRIDDAIIRAEKHYDREEMAICTTCVTAAKGNQVLLLSMIDDLKQAPDGVQAFSDAHVECQQLGGKLAALMHFVQAKLKQAPQQQQQQQQQPASPRTLSPRFVNSPERHRTHHASKSDGGARHGGRPDTASPERATDAGRFEKLSSPGTGKRGQGDEDSPKMKSSPAKRAKNQHTEQAVTSPSPLASDGAMRSPGKADAPSVTKPASPAKLPRLDWNSAKPISSTPHLPISTTPRSPKASRTETRRLASDDVPHDVPASPAKGYEARTGADNSEQGPTVATSPPSVPSQAKPNSPRRGATSPSKPLKSQPRPRPPSMLFAVPPLPPVPPLASVNGAINERAVETGNGTTGTGTVTTTMTTDGTPLTRDPANV